MALKNDIPPNTLRAKYKEATKQDAIPHYFLRAS